MKHRDKYFSNEREHHPRVGIGLFFIVLGLALLIATNDLLGLGSVSSYFTWETVLVFIGVLLVLNLKFMGGILMIATGLWFMQENLGLLPDNFFKNYYWPGVIILLGFFFILTSFFRRKY